jgi:hypothetical protein
MGHTAEAVAAADEEEAREEREGEAAKVMGVRVSARKGFRFLSFDGLF